ncbi:hypothetical protein [Streptomyces sp. NPDC001774]
MKPEDLEVGREYRMPASPSAYYYVGPAPAGDLGTVFQVRLPGGGFRYISIRNPYSLAVLKPAPELFFEEGHTYTGFGFGGVSRFTVITVAEYPDNSGRRAAFGWVRGADNKPYPYYARDFNSWTKVEGDA